MGNLLNRYKKFGENFIITNIKTLEAIEIKYLSDEYIKYLIKELKEQEITEELEIVRYFSNEWIELYEQILLDRRIRKLNKIKKLLNGRKQ